MIRFNQIAWPDIALLFDSRGRNARTTHFTACPCVCVCVFFFTDPRKWSNELLERKTIRSESRILLNSEEFDGLFVSANYDGKKREGAGGRDVKKLSLVTRGWSEFPVEGVTRLL